MTSLATIAQFSTKAGKAIEDFLYEKGKRSKNTERSYRGDINNFLLTIYNKSIPTITAEELELLDYDSFNDYLNSYYEKKSNSVINRYYSVIKSLYRDLNAMKVISTDMAMFSLIKTLPSNVSSYEAIPMDVAKEYVESTQTEKNDKEQKKMLIKAAIELGLRESELLNLEWKWFKVDGDRVYISGMGKGNKKYTEVISKDFYNELLTIKGSDKKVFTISRKNINDMMIRLKKLLNHEDRNYTFHSFKKTAVTNAYNLTGSITEAQKKGKHTYVTTTQIYLEETMTEMTGYYSLEGKVNHSLYKEVSHDTLLQALQGLSKEMLLTLNLKLQE